MRAIHQRRPIITKYETGVIKNLRTYFLLPPSNTIIWPKYASLEKSVPPKGLLALSLHGTNKHDPHFLSGCLSRDLYSKPMLLWVSAQSLLQMNNPKNSLAVRRYPMQIENGNYFNLQTHLKGGCGFALSDERDSGLWITENSRKSDKKGLVPE